MDDAAIVVIGAGPAGASAALHLADAGERVLLIDDKADAGGTAFPVLPEDEAAFLWPDRAYRGGALRQALRGRGGRIARWPRRRVEAIAPDLSVTVRDLEDGAVATVSSRAVIAATGAIPVALALPGSGLDGVLGLHDPDRVVATARERPGARVVLAGAGPMLWYAAAQCAAAGLSLTAVIDAAPSPGLRHLAGFLRQPGLLAQGLGWMRAVWKSGVPIHRRHVATAIAGDGRVSAVEFAALDGADRPAATPRQRVEADLLAIGLGMRPAIALLQAAGIAVERDPVSGLPRPGRSDDLETSIAGLFAIGDAGAVAGADVALAEGTIAAEAVLRRTGAKAGATLATAAGEARRQRRSLLAFVATLDDWAGPRAALIGPDQRDK